MNETYIPLSDLYNYTCADKGLILPLWSEYTWSPVVRAALYLVGMLWCFLGIAIAADVFMCAIEKITSYTRTIKIASPDPETIGFEEVEVKVRASMFCSFHYSAPEWGTEYCDERVCLSVSVFVCPRSYLRNYTSDLHQFLCMLPMAGTRSSSGGVVIRYVLPVLWMTLCLLISQGCSTSPPS